MLKPFYFISFYFFFCVVAVVICGYASKAALDFYRTAKHFNFKGQPFSGRLLPLCRLHLPRLRANDDNCFSFLAAASILASPLPLARFILMLILRGFFFLFLFCTSSSVFRRLSTISIKFY